MSRRPVFRLAPTAMSSKDTVECLKSMLHDAEAGEMIGLAAGAMYKRREYEFHACGEAHRSPTFTIGVLMAFVVELLGRIR